MSKGPLPQSADKSVLMSRLGLNDRTHRLLLDEAEHARDAMSAQPHNLTDQSRANPNVVPPYKWDEISETAKHNYILATVANATAQTRPYYQEGCYRTNVNEENWVARWYLWHAFRYRFVRRLWPG
ncbi:hypothetical protein T440DRAFT_487611 [Plenodomus tracheiphilus IPT5]|uniref:Uncharacterized protein n=1 Tax=Plenodomus tracheiphilus IPT5 TaxID=1408161 RepID=A0A6A7BC94_9PLEO|nr:hypothetical protein T440DRAFT_487611 [Plenodomus tracheiphilus IPT5]